MFCLTALGNHLANHDQSQLYIVLEQKPDLLCSCICFPNKIDTYTTCSGTAMDEYSLHFQGLLQTEINKTNFEIMAWMYNLSYIKQCDAITQTYTRAPFY